MLKAAALTIRLYQVIISPLKPACCRYIPTCSDYARQALHQHGLLYGSCLAFKRILRCHPFGGHGLDEVPPVRSSPHTQQRDA